MHILGGVFFLCIQGIRKKRIDEMSMLWEWIRGARVGGEKWETLDQAVALIQRAYQVGYV